MSPNTTPIAPSISVAIGGRLPGVAEALIARGVEACRRSARRGFLAAPREADVELLQLAVEVGALEPRLLGDAAHVALLAPEELLEVDALERLARLAKRKVEETRGELGRDRAA